MNQFNLTGQTDFLPEYNKYFKWYWNIIENAKNREKLKGYTEKHHIYPKSIYGKNKYLIRLTAKEHYIVHLVLWWGFRTKYGINDINTRKMAGAFHSMDRTNGSPRYNSTLFEFLRLAASEANKGRKLSAEHCASISKGKKGIKQTPEAIEINRKGHLGKKLSEETKKKISERMKKDWENPEFRKKILKNSNNPRKRIAPPWNKGLTAKTNEKVALNHLANSKVVVQMDYQRNFIAEYESVNEAARKNNRSASYISNKCNKVSPNSGEFIWEFKNKQ